MHASIYSRLLQVCIVERWEFVFCHHFSGRALRFLVTGWNGMSPWCVKGNLMDALIQFIRGKGLFREESEKLRV